MKRFLCLTKPPTQGADASPRSSLPPSLSGGDGGSSGKGETPPSVGHRQPSPAPQLPFAKGTRVLTPTGRPGRWAAQPWEGHGGATSFGDGPWCCQSPLGASSPAMNFKQLQQSGQILLSVRPALEQVRLLMLDCTFYELMAFQRSLPCRAWPGCLQEGWQLGAAWQVSPALSPSLRWGPRRGVWFTAVQERQCQDPTKLHRGGWSREG